MDNILEFKQKNKTMLITEGASPTFAEKVVRYTSGKVKFSAVIQTCGDINQNRRVYPIDVMKKGVERIQPSVKSRNAIGEMDHPTSISDDPKINQMRQTTVLYKESSHLFTKIWFEGNEIWANVETLGTRNGKDLAALVLDKVGIGFSLRGLADLEDSGTHQTVLDPLLIITWDCVQQPSHKQALIREIYQEEVLMAVNESSNLLNDYYIPDIMKQLTNPRQEDIKSIINLKINTLIEKNWKPV